MSDRDYYLIDDTNTKSIREKFLEKAHIVMETQTQLAKSFMTPIEQHNISSQYHKMSIVELKNHAPDINWDIFFETPGSQADSIMSLDPFYIKEVNNMSKTISLDKWKGYFALFP